MQRIKFRPGEQKKFLKRVIKELNTPSLRGLLQFGITTKYSTLKNYYNESRTLPQNLFNELCILANISQDNIQKITLKEHWGKVKGGKTSKRKLKNAPD